MISKNLTKNFLNFLIVALVYGLDRISKLYIIYLDKNNFDSEIFTSAYLNITLIWNRGIAFGLFSFDRAVSYTHLTLPTKRIV